MLLEFLGTIFTSILSGGATGLLGAAIQRFADYKNKQLDLQQQKQANDYDLQKRQIDLQITNAEWQGKLKVAQEEGATQREVADTQAFQASLLKEPDRYSPTQGLTTRQVWMLVLLDFARGIVRPALTLYLIVLESLVYQQAKLVLGAQALSAADALQIWKMVVGSILYLTTTCVLWWFGTRNKQPQSRGVR